jgi:hypothetical protein
VPPARGLPAGDVPAVSGSTLIAHRSSNLPGGGDLPTYPDRIIYWKPIPQRLGRSIRTQTPSVLDRGRSGGMLLSSGSKSERSALWPRSVLASTASTAHRRSSRWVSATPPLLAQRSARMLTAHDDRRRPCTDRCRIRRCPHLPRHAVARSEPHDATRRLAPARERLADLSLPASVF